MKVTQIQTSDYRNLHTQTVFLCDGLNVFVGDNAQGKTNLAESVFLCCIGKSPRAERDKDLIRWGKDKAFVKVNYSKRSGNGEIAVELQTGTKKKIVVNGVPLAKTGDLMGTLNCIYFSPNEIRIVSQSPAERRRFLDIDLCQTDKNYFYSLVRHNKALAQRNNALKQARTPDEARDSVFAWDRIIAEEGARIISKRQRFCQQLKSFAQQSHEILTDGAEQLSISYCTQIEGQTVKEIATAYLTALESNIEKDFQLRHTNIGCQRDDVALKINGVDVRGFGSQGQQRTVALSLKLAELTIMENLTGEFPVLILDDVLSELDEERQKRLLNFRDGLQIILTSATDISHKLLSKNCKIFKIKNGEARTEQ